MKISLISFTANGFRTEKRLVSILKNKKDEPCPYVMGKYAMQAAAKDHEISFMPVREGAFGLGRRTLYGFRGVDLCRGLRDRGSGYIRSCKE